MTRQYEKRYDKIFDQMELLGIKDVSTTRQEKNGTIVWQLPIKINYPGNAERFIEVASFKTGYVRNQNCGYSNYQLNKRCEGEPEYFQLDNGDFRKFTTRSCILIPNEIDRLEYLIGYCLKNYYIKNANQVANGGYVEQWYHDDMMKRQPKNADQQFKLNELQNKLANSVTRWQYDEAIKLGREKDEEIIDLKAQLGNKERHYQNLLKSKRAKDCLITSMSETLAGRNEEIIDLKAQLSMSQGELSSTKVRQDVSVIVNGHRYKVFKWWFKYL
jgi:hypothetical protein